MSEMQILVEKLENQRLNWLKINLAGFCVWDGMRIMDNHLIQFNQYLTGIMLLGGLLWMVSLIQIVRLGKGVKNNKKIMQILNDELTEIYRYKTWRLSLIAVMTTQVVFILISSFVREFSGILAAEVSIYVAVVSSIGGFLYYSTKSDGRV